MIRIFGRNEDLNRKAKEVGKQFGSLEECIDSFAIIDEDLDFVVHKLKAGEEVEPDTHNIDEWVVANNGKFEIRINDKTYSYDANLERGYIVFHIPKGIEHSLKTIKETKYYVFKGMK